MKIYLLKIEYESQEEDADAEYIDTVLNVFYNKNDAYKEIISIIGPERFDEKYSYTTESITFETYDFNCYKSVRISIIETTFKTRLDGYIINAVKEFLEEYNE